MKRNRYAIIVIFTEGRKLSDVFDGRSWKQRIRLIRRAPKVLYQVFGTWLCGLAIRSRHRHVLIGDSQFLLNYGFQQIDVYAYNDGIKMPNILGWIVVEIDMEPDMAAAPHFKKRSLWYATLARLAMAFSRGLYQCDNCTVLVRDVLQHHGLDVPKKCWNPKALLLWMTENGHDFIAGSPPTQG